jgi:hypothetical protein
MKSARSALVGLLAMCGLVLLLAAPAGAQLVGWLVNGDIYNGTITAPTSGAYVGVGTEVTCTIGNATDWDKYWYPGFPPDFDYFEDTFNGANAYTWSAGAGSWKNSDNTGQSVIWIAPTTAQDVTLTCTIADDAIEDPPDEGTRDDTNLQRQVSVHVVLVDLDIDGVTDQNEESVGAVVVRSYDSNNAPRVKITLQKVQPSQWSGNVILSRNNTKVKVYTAETGGTEITFNGTDSKFANGNLPKELWVQGDTASGSMRDVVLDLYIEGWSSVKDTVKFTVLWVEISASFNSGTVSNDNGGRGNYYNLTVPHSYNLGNQFVAGYDLTFPGSPMASGRGCEFVGTVAPTNFVPSQFSGDPHALFLSRDVLSATMYAGANGDQLAEEITEPRTDDTREDFRDDDPQSGGSGGKIYDVDAPGCLINAPDANEIMRYRVNFRVCAIWWDGANYIRCSPRYYWYIRSSYKATGDWDGGTATSGTTTTLTDTSKEWAADIWNPGAVKTSKSGLERVRQVTDNNDMALTVWQNWDANGVPDGSTMYLVHSRGGTPTWTLENTFLGAGDNWCAGSYTQSQGTTALTYDLQ